MASFAASSAVVVISALSGAFSHWTYFRHGEHHQNVVRIAQMFILIPIVALVGLIQLGNLSIGSAALTVGVIASAYLGALFSSLIVYRLFYHPLKDFPGPFGAKIGKFWHVAQTRFDNYKVYDRWFHEYGPYVRIGPNDLLITDPAAIPIMHGPQSKCVKSAVYDSNLPLMSLHQCRDRAQHDKRRKIWDMGFSMKAIRSYEGRVKKYTEMLAEQIESFSGQPLNASRWFNYFTFDVMGDLAFGRSFDMLQKGEMHFAIDQLQFSQIGLGLLGPLPWLLLLLTHIPIVSGGYWKFVNWCNDQAVKRSKMKMEERDLMSWLLEAEPMSQDAKVNENWLRGDARLIVISGSDTTTSTLTHIFFHLAQEPIHVEKIRDELAKLGSEEQYTDLNLRDLKHLNGIIDETLRLHPGIPAGVMRQTPPEGVHIGDKFIPGGVNIAISPWTIMRLSSCFKHPTEFIPERWYATTNMVRNKDAWIPFSLGPYGCAGRNLALMELRSVIASLVTRFDISFAPGEDGTALFNDTKDCLTLALAPLMLKFTPRRGR